MPIARPVRDDELPLAEIDELRSGTLRSLRPGIASDRPAHRSSCASSAAAPLPVVVRADPFDPSPQHGLQRIEVDASSGAMTLKALLAAPGGPTQYPDVSNDRSVQLGSKLVYLSEGQLVVADW